MSEPTRGEDFWMDELEYQLGRPLTATGRNCLRTWLRAFAAHVKRQPDPAGATEVDGSQGESAPESSSSSSPASEGRAPTNPAKMQAWFTAIAAEPQDVRIRIYDRLRATGLWAEGRALPIPQGDLPEDAARLLRDHAWDLYGDGAEGRAGTPEKERLEARTRQVMAEINANSPGARLAEVPTLLAFGPIYRALAEEAARVVAAPLPPQEPARAHEPDEDKGTRRDSSPDSRVNPPQPANGEK